jgi:hypothetical protein
MLALSLAPNKHGDEMLQCAHSLLVCAFQAVREGVCVLKNCARKCAHGEVRVDVWTD